MVDRMLEAAINEVEAARLEFNYAVEPYIDAAIYRLMAAEARLNALLSEVKEGFYSNDDVLLRASTRPHSGRVSRDTDCGPVCCGEGRRFLHAPRR